MGHRIYFFQYRDGGKPDAVSGIELTDCSSLLRWLFKNPLLLFDIKLWSILITTFLHIFRSSGWFNRQFRYILYFIPQIYSLCRRNSFDIIHSHHAGLSSYAVHCVAKSLSLPHVVTVHGSEFFEESNRFFLPFARELCANVNTVVAISEFTRSLAQSAGVEGDIKVIHNGIDEEEFLQEDIFEDKRRNVSLRILNIGWLRHLKGPDVLVEAMKRVRVPQGKELSLTICGVIIEPEFVVRIKEMIREIPQEVKVELNTTPKRDDILKELKRADIFVLPSRHEGFGIVSLEAMMNHLPVVASRRGGIPEVVVDKVTGFLVNPDNPEEFTQAIQKLIDDEGLRKKMGEEGFKRVKENFVWSKSFKKYEALFLSLVDKK